MSSVQPIVYTSARPSFMDFWSDADPLVTLPADTALPGITVAGLPTGKAVTRAILLLKYSGKEDTSAAENKITAGSVQVNRAAWLTGINLIDGEALVAASTKEGGDIHVGDNDVKAQVNGNGTYTCRFNGVTTTAASIKIYDVQVGLRIYFQ